MTVEKADGLLARTNNMEDRSGAVKTWNTTVVRVESCLFQMRIQIFLVVSQCPSIEAAPHCKPPANGACAVPVIDGLGLLVCVYP